MVLFLARWDVSPIRETEGLAIDLNSHQPRKKGSKVQKMHGGNVKANYP
jgi:hypothetical protein